MVQGRSASGSRFKYFFSIPICIFIPLLQQQPVWESECSSEDLTFKQFIAALKDGKTNDEWLYFSYKYMEEWFGDNSAILEVCILTLLFRCTVFCISNDIFHQFSLHFYTYNYTSFDNNPYNLAIKRTL
jgi:hypothetical protein